MKEQRTSVHDLAEHIAMEVEANLESGPMQALTPDERAGEEVSLNLDPPQ